MKGEYRVEGRGQRNKQDVKGEREEKRREEKRREEKRREEKRREEKRREEKRILCCLVGNRIRIIASIRFSQQVHVEIVFALLLLWMKVYL